MHFEYDMVDLEGEKSLNFFCLCCIFLSFKGHFEVLFAFAYHGCVANEVNAIGSLTTSFISGTCFWLQ